MRLAFLIESSFIALLGIAIGIALGFGLSANVIDLMAGDMAGSEWCWNHDPARAEERRRNASHAATAKHSSVGKEIRDVRFTVRELVFMTLTNELHPLVRKRLTEVVQLLQVYARLSELEIASMQAAGEKLPTFNAREALEVGLPEGTKEKVQDWVEGEQERVRQKEGEQVLKEVATLAESRGYDASALRHFGEQ